MKIAILTLPLHDNYGGLLQAYALKEMLISMGHNVTIINRRSPNRRQPIIKVIGSALKQSIKYKKPMVRSPYKPSASQREEISRNTVEFRSIFLPELSEPITTQRNIKKLNRIKFDAYIVGSDQCWRPIYSPKVTNHFLDFLNKENKARRIAYAASFGVSNWTFSKRETKICKKLIKNFDSVSVREDSGKHLLNKYLNRTDAVHVLDPTMLLSKEDYLNKLPIKKSNQPISKNLKVYVLDKSDSKQHLIDHVEKELNLKQFEVMPKKRLGFSKVKNSNIEEFAYPSPLDWIKGFEKASFVITDSFHGTVFSIIFNIPFITIANEHRGLARFHSLLNKFNLMDRLVTNTDNVNYTALLNSNIDWEQVNKTLEVEKYKSLKFLKESLRTN